MSEELTPLQQQLAELTKQIEAIAQQHQNSVPALLEILRTLDAQHRHICQNLFIPALPNTRHALFNLLLDIEAKGGWPHIYRISLKELCQNLEKAMAQDIS